MFKFGRSTRMYILGGPDELRPEQGLTREQRRTAAALEVPHLSACFIFQGIGLRFIIINLKYRR